MQKENNHSLTEFIVEEVTKLTDAELNKLEAEAVVAMNQVEMAAATAAEEGIYADRHWYLSAKKALRCYQISKLGRCKT
jgi:hypothetical protein